jgi:histidinol dehydrogenase
MQRLSIGEVQRVKRHPVDTLTLARVTKIVDGVRDGGESALRQYAEQFGDLKKEDKLLYTAKDLLAAYKSLPTSERALLNRTHARIKKFALAQRACLKALKIKVPGGQAGHQVAPVERAGCYAPGGRFPLPSSVLMTVTTARAAGVTYVAVASPKPTQHTLAAAHIAGADLLLAAGGAQAIAALAFGAGEMPACDVIVGPGNRFVTAAKQYVSGHVGIDMLAGPSELLVLADKSANAATIAADLLAQAEHDSDAFPCLVVVGKGADELIANVQAELMTQVAALPSRQTAEKSLQNGFCVACATLKEAVALCNQIAPEHLQLMLKDVDKAVKQLQQFGALFIGSQSAEVFGDYGVGPNHVLPTGQCARFTGGLSVFNFLRIRTYLHLNKTPRDLVADAAALARLEGLEAHARAAEHR